MRKEKFNNIERRKEKNPIENSNVNQKKKKKGSNQNNMLLLVRKEKVMGTKILDLQRKKCFKAVR